MEIVIIWLAIKKLILLNLGGIGVFLFILNFWWCIFIHLIYIRFKFWENIVDAENIVRVFLSEKINKTILTLSLSR